MKEVYGLLFKIGTATTIYKTTQIKSAICKSCKKAEKHFHHIEVGYSTYKHLPVYPTYKEGFIICQACKFKSLPSKMTTELWEAHSSIMDKAKYPFWTYLGSASIIIIFLTSIGILFSIKPPHNQSSFNQTLNPIKNVGNVIVVKENPYYTSFQITKIETESITLIPNKFSYRNSTSLDIVKERDFLNKKPFKIGVDSINTSIKGYKVIKVVILN